jgi:hypothetical protein
MAIDPARIGAAKKKIRAFRDELARYVEKGRRQDVYELVVAFLPHREWPH